MPFTFVTSNNFLFEVTFRSSLTVYEQLKIVTNRTTALGVYSGLKGRLVADWLVDNMNPDMTHTGYC